jgi:hypothetical protein
MMNRSGGHLISVLIACSISIFGCERVQKPASDTRMLSEEQTLEVLKLGLDSNVYLETDGAIMNIDEPLSDANVEHVFERYWKQLNTVVKIPRKTEGVVWEHTRFHNGYFFKVWKDSRLNCIIIYGKKGGAEIYAQAFGPSYSH